MTIQLDDGHGRQPRTAPQAVLFDDDLDPGHPGAVPLPPASENGMAVGTARARRSHRAQPRRSRRPPGSRRRRWPIVTVSLLVLVAVIVGGGYVLLRLTQEQYYVAESNGQVAIYRGVNYQILGYNLSRLYQQTGIPLAQVPSNDQQTVKTAYTMGSLSHVQLAVGNIRAAVDQCRAQYRSLQAWVTQDNKYVAQVAQANRQRKSTADITKPGAAPSVGAVCPPSQAFGIPASALSPSPAGRS